ncbi:predicted protein [Sclerotinia sclerotiorum 1980 UF-70]|uniref:Uncharacterized protein n=1 Tax=Sclerotinia sclerotiorum (strain ATCC 18683 / 1980 / Ss-1) TaxID=665079 RepID=A7EMF5_SCLS1|nr:predicted protein [Sclerotinia sclerotiorum 1980 UF-70]EDO04021.1 predicted protein [Sclerotinia sclerotiorum 1980 UF-70]
MAFMVDRYVNDEAIETITITVEILILELVMIKDIKLGDILVNIHGTCLKVAVG